MDQESLRKTIDVIKRLKEVKKGNRQQFLKICPEEYTKTLCEGCYNVVNGNIELTSGKKKYN